MEEQIFYIHIDLFYYNIEYIDNRIYFNSKQHMDFIKQCIVNELQKLKLTEQEITKQSAIIYSELVNSFTKI